MSEPFKTNNPELESLFDRYRRSPGSYVFAPLADACRKAGMLEEAIEICEKGVSAHPRYASGFVVRGKCYYDLGNADQAEASFEKVLELDANNLVALKYMGLILAERGQMRDARRHFEHILQLDPDDREIAAKLAQIGESDVSLDASLARELNDVLESESRRGESAPADAKPVEDEGDGDDSDAEPVDLRPVEDEDFVGAEITLGSGDHTPDVLATMTLADIYASQGYRKKAIKIYEELLAERPDHEGIRGRLNDLGVTAPGPPAAEPVSEPPAAAPSGEPERVADPPEPPAPDAAADEPAPDAAPDETVEDDAPQPAVVSAPGDEGSGRNAVHFKRWLENFKR